MIDKDKIAELRRLEAERPWDINDIDAVRNALPELLKALETLRQIENTACKGLDYGETREALIEIKYAARKALPSHGGVDVG